MHTTCTVEHGWCSAYSATDWNVIHTASCDFLQRTNDAIILCSVRLAYVLEKNRGQNATYFRTILSVQSINYAEVLADS